MGYAYAQWVRNDYKLLVYSHEDHEGAPYVSALGDATESVAADHPVWARLAELKRSWPTALVPVGAASSSGV